MFKIYFIVEEGVFPDEYDLGWLNLEHNDKILTSMEYSGKGLMMIFFSVTELLKCLIKLNTQKSKLISFIGEDSSYNLYFNRNRNNEVEIIINNKIWSKVEFKIFSNAILDLSESLYKKYKSHFEKDNIALKDWAVTRKEVNSIFHLENKHSHIILQ